MYGPDRSGVWEYKHSDGKVYICSVEILYGHCEIKWEKELPQGDWNDDGWTLLLDFS